MKKIVLSLITLISSFSLVCCNSNSNQNEGHDEGESGQGGDGGNKDPYIVSISASSDKLVYKVGEEFDLNSLIVSSLYSDETTKNVNLEDVTVSGFDSTSASASQELTITYQEFSYKLTISVEYPSPFKSLQIDDPYILYHDEGGFACYLYYDSEAKMFAFSLDDYSLGSTSAPLLERTTVSDDYHTLSFECFAFQSKFFNVTNEDNMVFKHDRYDNSIKLVVNDITYNLLEESKVHQYFLDPKLVGKWQINENVVIEITNKNFEPVINLSEGDVAFSTTLEHTEEGTFATLHGDKDGELLKNNDVIKFFYNIEDRSKTATISGSVYQLEEYVNPSLEYVEEYFYLANCPKGTMFTNGDISFKAKTAIGQIKRWLDVNEGEYSKEFVWDLKNNGATLELTFNDSAKTSGTITSGVTYSLNAIKEDDKTVIRLIGDDGLNLVMERSEA